MSGKRNNKTNVELDKARDYFRNINQSEDTPAANLNLDFDPDENETINTPITLDEIVKTVRTLKK